MEILWDVIKKFKMHAYGRETKITKHMTINLVPGHATLSSSPVLQGM